MMRKLIDLSERLQVQPRSTIAIDARIPIFRNTSKDFTPRWPDGQPPDWEAIVDELSRGQSALCRRYADNRGEKIEFLMGRYVLRTNVADAESVQGPVLWLLSVNYATGADRKRFVVSGCVVQHGGLRVDSAASLRRQQQVEPIITRLLDVVPVTQGRPGAVGAGDSDSAGPPLLQPEAELLESLDLFIDAEHEL